MTSINSQAPEKREHAQFQTAHPVYDVHSIFLTIQGEGPHSGKPAVFIRLAGCNLQCPWCDTEYTEGRRRMTVDSIVKEVNNIRPCDMGMFRPLIVISGGEPFRQNLTPLVKRLCQDIIIENNEYSWNVQIETNGTLPPSPNLPACIDVVCSPKTGTVSKKLLRFITAYKYVLSSDSVNVNDGLPIKVLDHSCSGKVARPHVGFMGPTFIQPMDAKDEEQMERNKKAAVSSAIQFGYILQLQIHKLVGVE